MPTMVVSKLLATVGRETEKIRLEVPAKKLPSAALMSSSQLVRGSMRCCVQVVGEIGGADHGHVRKLAVEPSRSTNVFLSAERKTQARLRPPAWKFQVVRQHVRANYALSATVRPQCG